MEKFVKFVMCVVAIVLGILGVFTELACLGDEAHTGISALGNWMLIVLYGLVAVFGAVYAIRLWLGKEE